MSDTQTDAHSLFEKFSRLGPRDRKAVLGKLSLDERDALEKAMAAQVEADEAELAHQRRTERQFLAYSPKLAELVGKAVNGDETDLPLRTRTALVEEHQALIASSGPIVREGWRGVLDRFSDLVAARHDGA